jgi:hypothetical protein
MLLAPVSSGCPLDAAGTFHFHHGLDPWPLVVSLEVGFAIVTVTCGLKASALQTGCASSDCIEFSARLRCGSTASEVAFLAMDIDARGRPDLAYWLVDRYVAASGDSTLHKILLFYAAYRAFVRGKVQSFRLHQPVEDAHIHHAATRRARHYLRLAWYYARVPKSRC